MNKKRNYTRSAIAIFLVLFTQAGFGQTVTAKADRDKILIGEQIKLQVKVENLPQGVAQWFNMPDTVNHLEVVDRSKIDTIEIAGNDIYQQTITITSFDSGHWQIPALSVVSGSKASLSTQPIDIDVIPVDVSQLQDYHDIKEIVEVEQNSSIFIIIAIVLITLVSLAVLIWLMRKKKAVSASVPQLKGNLSPLEWFRQELEKLRRDDLLTTNNVKLHYQRLTDIARQYFYLQLRHKSMHQTTDEWMIALQPLQVKQEVKMSFFQLLRLADTVKFAKYLPPVFENEQSFTVASQMVEEVAASQTAPIQSPNKNS